MADDNILLSELIKRAAAEHADLVDPKAQATTATPSTPGVSGVAKGLYAGGIAADVGSTLYGFTHNRGEGFENRHEANPLINWAGDKAALPIGAGMEIGTFLLLKKLLGDRHPAILNAIVGGAGIAHGAFGANNVRQFMRDTPQPTQPTKPDPLVGNVGELINNKK